MREELIDVEKERELNAGENNQTSHPLEQESSTGSVDERVAGEVGVGVSQTENVDFSDPGTSQRTNRDLSYDHFEDHIYGVLESEGVPRDRVSEASFRVSNDGLYVNHGDLEGEILAIPYDGVELPQDLDGSGFEAAKRVLASVCGEAMYETEVF